MAIRYEKTDWVNDETPLNAQNMNNIETGLSKAVSSIDRIPDWVMQNTKPFWATPSGIGADFSGAATNAVGNHNISATAHENTLAKKQHTHTLSQITNFPVLHSYDSGKILSVANNNVVLRTPAAVAFSGSYEDLTHTPTIPTLTSELINDSGYVTRSEIDMSQSGAWSGGYIDTRRTFVCGFAPDKISVTESNSQGAVTNTYDFSNNYTYDGTEIRFTESGFTIISPRGGMMNRIGYVYNWYASRGLEIHAHWGNISGSLSNQTDLVSALNSKQDVLTAGSGINISGNVISASTPSLAWGNITGTLSNQTDLNTALSGKQDVLTAGNNISISSNTISSDQVFIATYGSTTYSDIRNAYDAGKLVIVRETGRNASLMSCSNSYACFGCIYRDSGGKDVFSLYKVDASDDSWTATSGVVSNTSTVSSGLLIPNCDSVISYVNSQKELSYCTYGSTTYMAIMADYQAGKLPVCIYSNRFYILSYAVSGSALSFVSVDGNTIYQLSVSSPNTWSSSIQVFVTYTPVYSVAIVEGQGGYAFNWAYYSIDNGTTWTQISQSNLPLSLPYTSQIRFKATSADSSEHCTIDCDAISLSLHANGSDEVSNNFTLSSNITVTIASATV